MLLLLELVTGWCKRRDKESETPKSLPPPWQKLYL